MKKDLQTTMLLGATETDAKQEAQEDIRWALDTMYPSAEKRTADIQSLRDATATLETLAKNPSENLPKIFEAFETSMRTASHLLSYTHMKKSEDTRNTTSQKLDMEATQTYVALNTAASFLEPYLLSLDEEKQQALLNDEQLSRYHEFLERIFRKKAHMLSEKEEYILSMFRDSLDAPSDIYYYLSNADMKFPTIDALDGEQLKDENFVVMQKNANREVRKEAFEKYYETYNSFSNTISTAYYSNVKNLTTEAKLRKFDSARQMELFTDDVDVKVYDALIDSIHKYLPKLHKYYGLKKKALGLDEQHMYDVYMSIVGNFEKTYTFEEAKELCIASVAPLGEEYQAAYRQAFEDGWVDVYPRDGKAGGAYSSGSYDSMPFIMMNFNGSLNSVFTLAHEMGHSMHSYYAKNNNEFLYHDYTIFLAEVASTFNENLLLDYLLKRAESDEEKLYLLNDHLDSFKSTVFRQTMFAEFERETHAAVERGEGLTAEEFDKIYHGLNESYFGPEMVSDPLIAHEWMRIPHFYRDFYVYKYATGYCAATVLSQKVLYGGQKEVDAYLSALKDGNHHFPIDQLKMAGCDMSDPKTVDAALDVFAGLVDELETLL